MESVYVDDTVHWYSDTHQQPAQPAAEMEVTGSATQTTRVHSAACQQTEHDMLCGTVKATDTENADTEISTGSEVWSSHTVEQSIDQGLKTVFVSSRSSCLRQKTSCMALMDKVKHFVSAVLFVNFFSSVRELYSYNNKYYYLYYWTCSSLWLTAGCLQLHIFYLFTSGGASYRAKGLSSQAPPQVFSSLILFTN